MQPIRFAHTLRLALLLLFPLTAASAQGLQLTFGASGLQSLTFRGQTLENTAHWPGDRFHIWHMKSLNPNGTPRTDGEYGWGENNRGRAWNSATHTWTYTFVWGSIRTQYLQHGDALDIQVTTINRPDSGVTFDGATVYPVTLHPPQLPQGLGIASDRDAPAATLASWSTAEAALVVPDPSAPLYTGMLAAKDGAVDVVASSTLPDALPASANQSSEPLKPGQSSSYIVSLRFAAPATPLASIAAGALHAWTRRYPQTLQWNDRRILGTVFLASSPQGDKTRPAGFPTNPRRYFTDPSLDIDTPAGLRRFQDRILAQAQTVVTNLRRLDAQGAITWDIEGEQYPQDTSYACAPDRIATLAPEMESIVQNPRYPHMKLDDAYFKIIHDAGFRVGVCVRPQRLVVDPDGSAHQQALPDDQVAAELIRKIRYAHDRWNATIFYLDSTVDASGNTLPASVIEQAAAAFPDSLLIPEEADPRMYRATAPFRTFLFHGDLGTNPFIRLLYPDAFTANLINDVSAAQLAAHRSELVDSIRHGDILMLLATYWNPNNASAVSMYREAHHNQH